MSAQQAMQKDVDIMGVQRGAHKDGLQICAKFEFKMPGGTNADGTALWGWNDSSAAFCKNCGRRDLEHVVIRDFTAEAVAVERERQAARLDIATRPPARLPQITADSTATESGPSSSAKPPLTAEFGMYELEPGVVDPLAAGAYRDAAREQQQRKSERVAAVTAASVAAVTAEATVAATGGEDSSIDETERFKLEVERMVKEQLAKEKLSMLSAPVAGAPRSTKELLLSLGLEQYVRAFEQEAMEISVLVTLARSEGKEALDEALKEVGVKSVGHRLKIFAALQAS